MTLLTRRRALTLTIGGTAFAVSCGRSWMSASRSSEISSAERNVMQGLALNFMKHFGVPGLSVAIACDGTLAYNEALGYSNRAREELVSPSSLFRIASVSKPITSVGIFTLIEQGKLSLSDKIFGTGAILGTQFGTSPYRPYVTDISVDHLLTHTSGGWQNDENDPMFQNPQLSHADLISWTLDHQPLRNPPGEHFAYSNFGYCVLGRVIEKIAQMPYADYIRAKVLKPCQIEDMTVAGNTILDRMPNEVIYYGQDGEDPYDMNVARMDSHGGWLASAADLVRFAINLGGNGRSASLLTRESLSRMTTPSAANPPSTEVKYARGWNVRNEGKGNWWHNGSLPGTASILVRTASGFCWAALANTRKQPANEINSALDQLVWDMARQVRAWKP